MSPCPVRLVVALLLLPATGTAADWPQWGGSSARNMASSEKGLPESFDPGKKSPQGGGIDLATTKNVKWVARLGSQTVGNPVVAGGRVFLGTNDEYLRDDRIRPTKGGLLMCLDEATGKLLWQWAVPRYETTLPNFNYDCFNLGICSSPAVDGECVYVVTNRGQVLCMDVRGQANGNQGPVVDEAKRIAGSGRAAAALQPTDGDVLWCHEMVDGELKIWPQDASSCAVLVHGDLVYVNTSNGVDSSHTRVPRPLAPTLIALDKRTGRLVAVDDEKLGTRLLHGHWSSPSLGIVNGRAQVFFGGGDGVLYAFEALDRVPETRTTFKKVWSFDCNPAEYKTFAGRKHTYLDGDVRKHHGNTNDGTFTGPSEIIATPVFHGNRVYIATGQDPAHGRGRGMLSCIDATKTGDVTASGKVWTREIGRSLSTVSIADGLVFVADTFEALSCLDAETGECYWRHPTGSEVWGSTFVVDGKVFVGTKKGLLVFAATREKKLFGEIRLGSPLYCTPIAANGTLYVASYKYLWAVAQNSSGR